MNNYVCFIALYRPRDYCFERIELILGYDNLREYCTPFIPKLVRPKSLWRNVLFIGRLLKDAKNQTSKI